MKDKFMKIMINKKKNSQTGQALLHGEEYEELALMASR